MLYLKIIFVFFLYERKILTSYWNKMHKKLACWTGGWGNGVWEELLEENHRKSWNQGFGEPNKWRRPEI